MQNVSQRSPSGATRAFACDSERFLVWFAWVPHTPHLRSRPAMWSLAPGTILVSPVGRFHRLDPHFPGTPASTPHTHSGNPGAPRGGGGLHESTHSTLLFYSGEVCAPARRLPLVPTILQVLLEPKDACSPCSP